MISVAPFDPRKTMSPAEFIPADNLRFMDVQSSCNGKVRYSKRSHAEAALLKIMTGKHHGRRRVGNADELAIYRCRHCSNDHQSNYHIGHTYK